MVERCERCILCLTIIFLCVAGSTAQSRHRRSSSTPKPSVVSGIRRFDFRNFTYSFDDATKIGVRNGKWEKRNPEPGDLASFYISQIAYGDLTGDGEEEAFIIASGDANYGASGWNSVFERYYIYAMSDGKPELLWAFSSGDLDRLYAPYASDCDGRVMGTKARGITSRIISLNVETYTPSCNIVQAVLLRVRLDAGRLVLVGRPIKQMRKR